MDERIIMEQVVDVKQASEQLKQFGIIISRDLLYSCWRTPYRNNTRSWWLNPQYQDKLIADCPLSSKHNLRLAFQRQAVHINVHPYNRKTA